MRKLLEKAQASRALSVVLAGTGGTIILNPSTGLAGQLSGITIAGIIGWSLSAILVLYENMSFEAVFERES